MTSLVRNKVVGSDMGEVYEFVPFDWNELRRRRILVTGSCGLIGSFIIRCLLHANAKSRLHMRIIASCRDIPRARSLFDKEIEAHARYLHFQEADVCQPFSCHGRVDYIIHAAGPASSSFFVQQPELTQKIIVEGTRNMLEFAREKKVRGMVYLSSMEAFGIIHDAHPLTEQEFGDIDPSNPRHSYMAAKREAEALCRQYAREFGLPVRVARLAQITAGCTPFDHPRVYAYFARCVVEHTPIRLQTSGASVLSSCYITDALRAILLLLLRGNNGNVYNVAYPDDAQSVAETAATLSKQYSLGDVVVDKKETDCYVNSTLWRMDVSALEALGWRARIPLAAAYSRLISSFYYQLKKASLPQKPPIPPRTFSIKTTPFSWQVTLFGVRFSFKRRNWAWLRYKLFSLAPIKRKKIVFINYRGRAFGCNPKYIAEEILRRKLAWDIVWLVAKKRDHQKEFPTGIRPVNYASWKAMRELSSAHFVVDNYSIPSFISRGLRKRPGQIYVNTWHGSFGIKKMWQDTASYRDVDPHVQRILNDKKYFAMIDYDVTHSDFENKVIKSSFHKYGSLVQLGHPRNDVFFRSKEWLADTKKRITATLGIPEEKKLMLFAPTYRKDGTLTHYLLDADLLLSVLGEDWWLVLRAHPNMSFFMPERLYASCGRVVNASHLTDTQELLVAADAMITDYSSCIFDFMLSRKPGFFYVPDAPLYEMQRGLYYPQEETPFPVAHNDEELISNIRSFDRAAYEDKIDAFLQRMGSVEDGHASERVVDLLQKLMERRTGA